MKNKTKWGGGGEERPCEALDNKKHLINRILFFVGKGIGKGQPETGIR